MAKRTVDPCIFCTALPCVCDGPVKQKRTGKRLPSVPILNTVTVELPADDVPPQSATSRLDRMRAKAAEDAARMPAPRPVEALSPSRRIRTREPGESKQIDTEKVKARIASTLDEDTVVLNGAIRALEPLLSLNDRIKYSSILESQPSLDEQKLLWKARHRDRQAAASS